QLRRELSSQLQQAVLAQQVRSMQSHIGCPPIRADHARDPSVSQLQLNVLLPEQIPLIFSPTKPLTSGIGSHPRSWLDWLVERRPRLLGTSAPPRHNFCRDTLHMLAHKQTYPDYALRPDQTLAVWR